MTLISERAEKFAKRFIKKGPPPDNRSVDEKMAAFHAEFGREKILKSRDRVKKVRNG